MYNQEDYYEQLGRENYIYWISTKPECEHVHFTNDKYNKYDAMFLSAGALCVLSE